MKPITISERASRACRFRWFVGYGLGLRPKMKAAAARKGNLWHTALEGLWAGVPVTECLEPVKKKLADEVKRELMTEEERAEILSSLGSALVGYTLWWPGDRTEFEVVETEKWISERVRTATGRKGKFLFGGILDHVVKDRTTGDEWLVEHKAKMSGGVSAFDVEKRRYEPQAVQYALLWKEATGRDLAGVMYDFASVGRVPKAEEWPMLVSGKGLVKNGPSGAIPQTLKDALELNGLEFGCQPWHAEKLNDLYAYQQTLFVREYVRFSQRELDLARAEIYIDAREIERDRRIIGDTSEIETTASQGQPDPVTVMRFIDDVGAQFPRNGKMCWEYNRLCEHAELCQSRNESAVFGYQTKTAAKDAEKIEHRKASDLLGE